MDSTLQAVLSEVNDVARQQNWAEVTNVVDTLLHAPHPCSMLVVTSIAEVTSFQTWLAEVAPQEQVHVVSFDQLASDHLLFVRVPRVLAIFECGRLVEPAVVDLLTTLFFRRPPGSYAMVLVNAESISSPQDMESVERIAWGALVSGHKAQWERKNLNEQNVYLWSKDTPANWLIDRLRQHETALKAWLQTRVGQNELMQYQALYAIELALTEAHRTSQSAATPIVDPAQSLYQTRSKIRDLHNRLAHRLDGGAETTKRLLQTSLDSLRSKLLRELHPFLRDSLSQGNFDDEQLVGYLARRAERWQREAFEKLESYETEKREDAGTLFEDIDWTRINQLVTEENQLGTYPENFLRALVPARRPTSTFINIEMGRVGHYSTPLNDNPDGILENTILTAMGAGVLSAFGSLIGPVGAATGAAIGATGGMVAGRMLQQRRLRQNLSEYEQRGQQFIQTQLDEAHKRVGELVEENRTTARKQLKDEFEALEKILDQAYQRIRASASAPSYLERLQNCWQQVMDWDVS
ncbi:MAG: hypothetical protein HC893_01660 [Chloroflexaceae bacterium]|nr:hypothetical protein [Chloroflexaceae bacterium]